MRRGARMPLSMPIRGPHWRGSRSARRLAQCRAGSDAPVRLRQHGGGAAPLRLVPECCALPPRPASYIMKRPWMREHEALTSGCAGGTIVCASRGRAVVSSSGSIREVQFMNTKRERRVHRLRQCDALRRSRQATATTQIRRLSRGLRTDFTMGCTWGNLRANTSQIRGSRWRGNPERSSRG